MKNNPSKFNKPIDNLPSTITHITLKEYFNQPINYLKYGIESINIGLNFNNEIYTVVLIKNIKLHI